MLQEAVEKKIAEAKLPARGAIPLKKAMTMHHVDTNIILTYLFPSFFFYSRFDRVCAVVHGLVVDSSMTSSS